VVFLACFVLGACGVQQFHVLAFEEENGFVELGSGESLAFRVWDRWWDLSWLG
jgi:hypothetical protein